MSKWTDTPFTRRLGVAYPIIQGPFGRGSSSQSQIQEAWVPFGANDLGPRDILNTAVEIRKLTHKPFALNLWSKTTLEATDSDRHPR
jgi:nitronate monooxygenase